MNFYLYVAGRFKNYAVVRAAIDRLAEAGNTITHDWTRSAEFDEHGHPLVPIGDGQSVDAMSDEEARRYALMDIHGVFNADAVVLIASEGLYGALIEVGVALGQSVEVWIVGDMPRGSVFFELSSVRRFADIDEVISYTQSVG